LPTEPTPIFPRSFGATEVVEPRAFLELSKAADGRLPPQAAVSKANAAVARIAGGANDVTAAMHTSPERCNRCCAGPEDGAIFS
jgi:hypothetical protein